MDARGDSEQMIRATNRVNQASWGPVMKCELLKVQTEDLIRLDGGLFRADEVSSTNSVFGSELARSDFRGDDSKGDDLSRQTRSPVDLVIFIPGVGSNFYQTGILGKWIPIFNQAGISLLSINTRGHDFLFRNGQRWLGAAVERVDECRLDIAAWVKPGCSGRISTDCLGWAQSGRGQNDLQSGG